MTAPVAGGSPISWAELARLSLARQFPSVDSVSELVRGVGPIQAQAARAPFLGIAARLASADHATITAAYEDLQLVRGSTIRATVHTCVAEHHPVLDVLTRLGIGSRWRQHLSLSRVEPEELWVAMDEYATPAWRTPAELREFMRQWLQDRDSVEAAAAVEGQVGRHLAYAHGSMIRRPLKGGWEGQGAPGYRTASALLGDRSEWYAHPDRAAREAILLHLRCHGPSSRHDIAWWAGLRLQRVDRGLAELAGDLIVYAGPDDRSYFDLADGTPPPREVRGILLLPEFDALFCAYDPRARTPVRRPRPSQGDVERREWSAPLPDPARWPGHGLLATGGFGPDACPRCVLVRRDAPAPSRRGPRSRRVDHQGPARAAVRRAGHPPSGVTHTGPGDTPAAASR